MAKTPLYGNAPYNPYESTEDRPLGGYPSEFAVPGKLTNSGTVRPATDYQRIRYAMKELNFTPRPMSNVYKGQYKVLRKVNAAQSKFNRGSTYVAQGIICSVLIYSLFFHRWNDGYDHIFSDFYRFQLKVKWFITGSLSKQEYDDLTPKQKGLETAMVNELNLDLSENENKFALQRPSREHIVMAEKIAQEREEKYLKAVDIAEKALLEKQRNGETLASKNEEKKSWFEKWF